MPTKYTFKDIENIKKRHDIVQVVGKHVHIEQCGQKPIWKGMCPYCSDSGSFMVNRKLQIYHCFSCHSGGDVIKFTMDILNYGFIAAIKKLQE